MLRSDYARLRPAAALVPHWRPVRWRLLPLGVKWQPKIGALSRVAAADARLRAEWKEGEEKGEEGRKGCINVTLQSAPGAACGGQQPCPETATSEQQHSSKWKWTRGGAGEGGEEEDEAPNEIRMTHQINYCSVWVIYESKGRKTGLSQQTLEDGDPPWWRCHKVKMQVKERFK